MKHVDMKKNMVLPRLIGQASVIQQLGLDTPQGVQRLLMMLLHYADPESKGIVFDIPTINKIIHKMVDEHKNNLSLIGEDDKLIIKAVDGVELYMIQKQQKAKK